MYICIKIVWYIHMYIYTHIYTYVLRYILCTSCTYYIPPKQFDIYIVIPMYIIMYIPSKQFDMYTCMYAHRHLYVCNGIVRTAESYYMDLEHILNDWYMKGLRSFIRPICRTSRFFNSFIPTSVRLLNDRRAFKQPTKFYSVTLSLMAETNAMSFVL